MFIINKPAMKISSFLIITDLHIGITKGIREKGIHIPSQIKGLVKEINALKKATKTTRLILLGDVKHRIPSISWQEKRELPEFFSLLKYRKIILIKGNHDGLIEEIVPEKVTVKKSYSFKDYVFTHGHRNVATKKSVIVTGHNQAHVKFHDAMGATYIEPVWVRGPLNGVYKNKEIIMVPAFNDLAGATLINRDQLLGPIAKHISRSRTHCYLLDGTDLGTIKDLRID